jgi:hypothetical protein
MTSEESYAKIEIARHKKRVAESDLHRAALAYEKVWAAPPDIATLGRAELALLEVARRYSQTRRAYYSTYRKERTKR